MEDKFIPPFLFYIFFIISLLKLYYSKKIILTFTIVKLAFLIKV
nr:MAG TPA: hypothetical protein [Caudoviricetes sp.]